MSIKSTIAAEVDRDTKDPASKKGGATKSKSDVLVDSIPTEILGPYTAMLLLIGANSDLTSDDGWRAGMWVIYAVCAVGVPLLVYALWLRDKQATTTRRVPVAGMVGSAVAFAAWGLVMPGAPLQFAITDGGDRTIWSGLIVIVAAGILGLLPLNKKTKKAT